MREISSTCSDVISSGAVSSNRPMTVSIRICFVGCVCLATAPFSHERALQTHKFCETWNDGCVALRLFAPPIALALALSVLIQTPAQAAPSKFETPDLNLVATPDPANLAINLTWDGLVTIPEHPVTDYRIRYKQLGAGKWATYKHEPSTETRFTATDFGLGLKLLFSVEPVFSDGIGSASMVKVDSPMPTPEPAANAAVQSQLDFLTANWNNRKSPAFGYLDRRNCANFASQSLLARGWKMNGSWFNRGNWNLSSTWVSSTAMSKYIKSVEGSKNIKKFSNVKVGDMVFFDWDGNGGATVRDHTAVVTLVRDTAYGRKIYYASHTTHGLYQSVIGATELRHPGSKAYFIRPADKNF